MEKTYELVSKHENGLEGEVPVAHAKKVFERGTEKVDDHDIVVALFSGPVDPRDTGATHEGLVDLALLFEGGRLCDGGFELDGDFLASDGMDTLEDGTYSKGERG